MTDIRADLIDELESFDPDYQKNYPSLAAAALAAGQWVYDLWKAYMATPEGQELAKKARSSRNYVAENEARKKLREAEISMSNRGKSGGSA